jgi:tight adherence protein B
MTTYIVFFVVLTLFMVGAILVANSFMRKREVAEMKDLVSGKATKSKSKAKAEGGGSLLKNEKLSPRDLIAQTFLGRNLNQRLRDYIEQAGMDWDPARTLYMSAILGVGGFNLFWYIIPRGQMISPIGAIVGVAIPFFILWRKRTKRMYAFEEQFPDALEFVARAMRTGHAFSVSLEMLYKDFGPPLSDEFKRTFDEQNLGLPLEVALERLGTRVPLLDVRFFVSAVMLQKRTGGNLATLLDNLSYLMKERFKLRGKIRAISAHGRISGLVLSMIPICVGIMMFFTNDEYVLFFFDDPDGKIMMAATIILQLLGFISIRKLTDLGV